MNRLTQKSQEALQSAQEVAQRLGHTETDGEHLLMALGRVLRIFLMIVCR